MRMNIPSIAIAMTVAVGSSVASAQSVYLYGGPSLIYEPPPSPASPGLTYFPGITGELGARLGTATSIGMAISTHRFSVDGDQYRHISGIGLLRVRAGTGRLRPFAHLGCGAYALGYYSDGADFLFVAGGGLDVELKHFAVALKPKLALRFKIDYQMIPRRRASDINQIAVGGGVVLTLF